VLRGVYPVQLALGGAGLGAAAAAVGLGVSAVHVAPAAAHRLAIAGIELTYPALNVAAVVLLALAALGAAVLIVAARAAWRQMRAHRRLVSRLHVVGALPGHPRVSLIRGDEPLAFCAGWLRPRVYLSTGVVARLSGAELGAVLAHEQHHRALRDPLRLAVGRVLSQALFFLPVLRPLHDRYGEIAELDADAAAVAASGGVIAPLASAMLAFGAADNSDGVGIAPERVDSLLGLPGAWRLPWALLIVGLVTLAATLALAWRASTSATAEATLNFPIASSQPCVLVLALVPVVASVAGAISRTTAAS
jgi:hypothetical protein